MAHARFLHPRLALLFASAVTVSAGTAACGGSAPPPTAAHAAPSASPTAALPGPDLSEVPEPADLVALVRWNNPEASANAVQGWTGLPLSLRELTDKLPPWLGAMAATNAPADFVLTLSPGSATSEPSFEGAVAIGLNAGFEEARRSALAHGEQLHQLQPGVHRLDREIADLNCALAASVGPTPTRLVCAENTRDIDHLAPYLTRTLSKQSPPNADLSIELRLVPFEKRYATTIQQGLRMGASVLPAQLHIGQPSFDRALTDAIYALADEAQALTTDLDALSLGLTLQPEAAKASLAVKFRGSKSWTVGMLEEAGTRAAAAPPMFWRLPAESTAASFGRGARPERSAAIRRTLSNLLDGWLTHEGVKPADRQAFVELLSDRYATDAATVAASGPYDAKARAAILGNEKSPRALAAKQTIVGSGWQLIGIDEPADKWTGALRKLVAAYQSPAVQKQVRRGFDALDIEAPAPQVKLTNASKELPQGSLELALTFFPDASSGKKTGASVQLFAILMPDAGRTWLAVGGDRASLVERLRVVQASAPESATLASRKGLEKLKSGSFTSAGFVTVSGMMHSMQGSAAEVLAKAGIGDIDLNRVMTGIPHGGLTPIVFEGSVQREGASSVWSTEMVAPKGAIEDVVAAVMHVAVGQFGAAMGLAK